jgi:translation initiation factor 2 subunit 3
MTTTMIIRETEVLERQATHLVGTLGHVSEGKSTLIRALTGVKTQRHAKEQERNITIHLGYANCKVWQNRVTGELTTTAPPMGTAAWDLVAHLSWVDCPGHEAYLATMLGGTSVMDTACLIIAANQEEIPQPQTREHLLAAELMGLERLAILQNKLDLYSDNKRALSTLDKIRAFTVGTIAETAPIFPGSAQHGWGVQRVLEWAIALPPPARDLQESARLTCVRSFDINKPGAFRPGQTTVAGAVIGGTLDRGVLAVGDWLEVRPGVLSRGPDGSIRCRPIMTRVRGLRCENTELPYAIPGSLIAIATDLDPGLGIANGMIGQRVGVPGTLPSIVERLQLRMKRLKRDVFEFGKHRVGDRVRISANVMTTEGTVTAVDDKKRVTVKLDRPLCLEVGEQVGVLRFNREAGRELIEGSGEVRATFPWYGVDEPEGAALAVAPDRVVVWEPRPAQEWSARAAPSYDEMLDAVMARIEESAAGPSRIRLPDPAIERVPKHTLWVNWVPIVEMLDRGSVGSVRYADHMKEWVEAELQIVTSLSGSEPVVLDMRGFWKVEDLRSLMRRYVGMWKRCKECSGYDTGIVRDGRVLKVRCARCQTDSAVVT